MSYMHHIFQKDKDISIQINIWLKDKHEMLIEKNKIPLR